MVDLHEWFFAHVNKTIDVDGVPMRLLEITRVVDDYLPITEFRFMLDEQALMAPPRVAEVIEVETMPLPALPEPKPDRDYLDDRYW
jgi:hypothetical protein